MIVRFLVNNCFQLKKTYKMTTYKGYQLYEIDSKVHILFNGNLLNEFSNDIIAAKCYIDEDLEDLTPSEMYEGHEIKVSNGTATVSKDGKEKKVLKGNVSDAKFFIDAWLMVEEIDPDGVALLEEKETEAAKKKASYWKTWHDEHGENMHLTEEEKDDIQKHNQ